MTYSRKNRKIIQKVAYKVLVTRHYQIELYVQSA